MARKRYQLQLTTDDPGFVADLNERIHRLREMLAVMAPELGSSALGATLPSDEQPPLSESHFFPSAKAANL